jgi:amidophosphoribosyltransferase
MCGVVGVIGRNDSPFWASRGLYALQHRGHDSCGVAFINQENNQLEIHSGKGAVADVLSSKVTDEAKSVACIAQNLYTTFGIGHSPQPFGGSFWDNEGFRHHVAVVHNGQLCGVEKLRRKFPSMFRSQSDSEVIFALLPHMKGNTMLERIIKLVQELEGAFSLIFLSEEGLTAVRDPDGFRPLVMGKDEENDSYMFASEVNAFDMMESHFQREIKPGEIVHIKPNGEIIYDQIKKKREHLSQCVFEHIYFARPDNQLFGKPGYSTQRRLGQETAKELKEKLEADVVVPVPDSATIASLGFAEEFGVSLEMGILRHHFASRTFITRGQDNRERAVRLKFNVVKDVVKGKRVILVDDSLVRSTTSRILIRMLRKGGAKEIHMVLFSPPIQYSCIYGINTPTREELIAYQCQADFQKIATEIGADSVNYLSQDGLKRAMAPNSDDYCYACMNGDYPIQQQPDSVLSVS